MLRALVARISAFREYSVCFAEVDGLHKCFVQTFDDHTLMSVCVRVESVGQRVPEAELAGLSRVIDSTASCQMPLSCHGGSPTLLRVFSDTRVDGREFLMYREFDAEVLLYCFRLAHQEVFGGLETTTMVDYLMLRLRGALQESWCESVPNLRRCIVAGRVDFVDLQAVVTDLIAVWSSVQDFVRHTGPRHFKTGAGRVRNSLSFFSFFLYSRDFSCSLHCSCGCERVFSSVGCMLQMRGTDWHVYSESTGELRLGLLLHILELREYDSGV